MKYLIACSLLLFQLFLYGQQQHIGKPCYYQSISASNGLPSNYVLSLCEDENNFLWAGTDKGLCRYNGFNWQVWDKDNGLPGNYIASVLSDKRGGLWLNITEKGIYHFNILTGKADRVQQLKEPVDNRFQVDVNGDLFRVFTSNNGDGYDFTLLSPLNLSYLKTVFTLKQLPDSKMVVDLPSQSVFFLKYGQAFKNINFNPGGWKLKYRDISRNIDLANIHLCNDSVILTNTHYYKFSRANELITDVPLFENNNAYFLSLIARNGYYIYNMKTGYHFIDNNGLTEFHDTKCGLGSDFIVSIYEMHDGTVLFATLGAGLQWRKIDYQTTFTTGKPVRCVIKADSVWYGIAGSDLFRLNERQNSFKVVSETRNSSACLLKSGDNILTGSLNGIEFFNTRGGYHKDHVLIFTCGISSILKIPSGYMIASYGNGLVTFNDTSTRVMPVRSSMNIIERAIPLRNGYALLSYEEGLDIIDTVKNTKVHLSQPNNLLSNTVYDVHQKNDSLWIGTRNGISVFTNGKIVKNLSYHEGFTGDKVISTFHYKQQLWVLSNKYLHVYDGSALRAITSYSLLPANDEHIITATFDSSEGTLAIGSEKTVSIIRLASINMHTSVSVPRILRVMVDGRIQNGEHLRVPNQFRKIVFDLAPYSASPLSKGVFLYRLLGTDENWLELKDSLAISYEALRPGDYTLVAKILNADGYAGPETVIACFIVDKPFWQKGWFMIVMLILTIFLTVLIVQYLAKRRQQKIQAALQLKQTLQQERERISKDLHDHLGSNLVTIVAQVDNIESKLKSGAYPDAANRIRLLSSQAREVMTVLRETIWAVQENEHSLSSFVIRIRTFLQRLFDSSGIMWHVNILDDESIMLSPKQTLQLFRIIQEVSQNILKHSHASSSDYTFKASKSLLSVHISDNGIGFNDRHSTQSNGLNNLRQRVKLLEGTMTITSDEGFQIFIDIPLAAV